MPGANHIADLLEGLRGEAEFESAGRFTLDFQKALEKVEKLSQEFPARWLLFAVQSGVALGAASLEVSLAHQRYSLTFAAAASDEWRQLLESPQGLTGEASSGGRGISYLSSALLWARALRPRRVQLALRSPQRSWLLEFDEEGARVGRHTEVGSHQLCLHVEFSDRSVTRTAELSQQLSERLCFCPVPVIQEGRSLNTGIFPRLPNLSGWYARWVLLEPGRASRLAALHPANFPAVRLGLVGKVQPTPDSRAIPVLETLEVAAPGPARLSESQPSIPLVRWTEDGRDRCLGVEVEYHPERLPASWQNHLLECRALFHRGMHLQPLMWIVQDGLVLDSLPLDAEFPGWSVALASQAVKTDLTGLRLIADADLEALKSWVQGHILATHQREHQRRREN